MQSWKQRDGCVPGWLLSSGEVGEGLSFSSWEDHAASVSECNRLHHQFRIKHGKEPRTWSMWSVCKPWLLLSHGYVSFLTKDVVWLLHFSGAEGNSGLCTKSLMRISHCCSLNIYGSMKNAKLMLNAYSKCTGNSLHSTEKHLLGIWGPQ